MGDRAPLPEPLALKLVAEKAGDALSAIGRIGETSGTVEIGGRPDFAPAGGDGRGPVRPAGPRVPPRFAWARFDAPEFAERVPSSEARRRGKLVASNRASATLIGDGGTGKTSLAVAMLMHAERRGRRFIAARMLGRARALYGLGKGEPPLVDLAVRASILVLDDLGAEQAWEQSAIPDVIASRYDAMLPTWITTGLSLAELDSRYGQGLFRRTCDPKLADVIDCNVGRGEASAQNAWGRSVPR